MVSKQSVTSASTNREGMGKATPIINSALMQTEDVTFFQNIDTSTMEDFTSRTPNRSPTKPKCISERVSRHKIDVLPSTRLPRKKVSKPQTNDSLDDFILE